MVGYIRKTEPKITDIYVLLLNKSESSTNIVLGSFRAFKTYEAALGFLFINSFILGEEDLVPLQMNVAQETITWSLPEQQGSLFRTELR